MGMRIVAAITIVAMFIVVSLLRQQDPILTILAVPIFLAVGFVVLRRHSPGRALMAGALLAFGIVVSVGLSFTFVMALLGEFDDCEGFCVTNSEQFARVAILLVIVAAPIAAVGGLVSALASYTLLRPTHSNQH